MKYKVILSNIFCIFLFILIVTVFSYLTSKDKKQRYKYEIICKNKTIYCNEIYKYQDHYNMYDTNETDEDLVKIDDVINIKVLK